MSRIATKLYPSVFSPDESKAMYLYLKSNCPWQEGVKTRHGKHTRKACAFDGEDTLIQSWIQRAIDAVELPTSLIYLGAYINYYRNGNDYTPAHSHSKQCQVVISLGATRTLTVGKKEYRLKSGDVIVFGSSTHSVPKEPKVKRGRISIATFSARLR